MNIKSMIPWNRERDIDAERQDPFFSLQREINSLFDDHFRGFFSPASRGFENAFSPRVDISENDREIVVSAEVPGIEEKDVEVSLGRGELTISGEKKIESEDRGVNYHRLERSYGSFRRTIALPSNVDEKKVEASFKKGVLRIVLPKSESDAAARKKIQIKSG